MFFLCDLVQGEREVSPPNPEDTGADVAHSVVHGIEVAVEFKPVEHPVEPLDNDKPVMCPLPEPSILNVSSNFDNFRSLTISGVICPLYS